MNYSSATTFLKTPTWHTADELIRSTTEDITHDVSGLATILTDVRTVMWYVVPPALLAFGTFGNVMTVLVMRGMRSSHSTACLSLYFTALAVSDQVQLTISVLFHWVDKTFSWPPSFFRYDLLCSLPKFAWNASSISSAWLLVAMTYQRVISVMVPHRVGVLCTVGRGKIVVAVIIVIACALNIQFLFTYGYWPEYGQCQYLEKYLHILEAYEWQDLVSFSMAPFLSLAVGNSILVWQVIKSKQLSKKMRGSVGQQTTSGTDKVHSMTVTLILTSAAFLVLTLPICTYGVCVQMNYIVVSDNDFGAIIKLLRVVTVMLWITSCASNFYLYLLSGRKFREETKQYLCFRGDQQGT
ncbi:cysteinyl leukotriene receptor 1-like [Babylonia areolata]|uniref:cysteinyl leukotriene receptor 1-like n=1 Tax=Babylonia areolata TaxID=304850 RepID=UPI003FCFC941